MLKSNTSQSPTLEMRQIWKHICRGDEMAFTHLYDRYFTDLFRYGGRVTKDTALVEDSIQDLFVEVWKTRETLPAVDSVKYYLFKRLKRKIVRKLVDQRKTPLANNELKNYNFSIVFSHESALIAHQISEEQQQKLLYSLNKLTRRQKEAITLRFYDGFTNQEVANLLSMNTKSVRNLIYRAMLALRRDMVSLILLLPLLNRSL